MLKRILTLLLLLSILPLCWACSKDKGESVKGPRIRYEDATAYYTHEGGSYTMDLKFEKTLTPGSKISLLLEEDEVLTFTTEAAISHLRLSSPKLEKDKPYTLQINGKLQKHGSAFLSPDVSRPGDIPEPILPTVPVEPMGEAVPLPTTEPVVTTESTNDSLSFENPPTISVSGEIPALTPVDPEPGNGLLPQNPFTPGQGEDQPDLTIRPRPQSAGTSFTLTGVVTEFTAVGDAE